ncbi:MAG: NAD-dependent epimerase/dehydratase family protein [Coraliomargarita sp. TMED73]|nr:MAG: NAD-dependent epimerase/dehydratase family protein [Coraliomargarita sp. TMED73]|tara:strand:- start:1676 stop:2668 length:993 start_codon:yes stop_codon:yes gene_type:complete
MKVLVTGGGGFLGRQIVERLLARGFFVRSIGRSERPELSALGVESIACDLLDADAVRTACGGMDAVFHVAAKAGVWGSWRSFYEPNFVGTRNVIEACLSEGVSRLVHTSTPSVVFNRMAIRGGDESLPYGNSGLSHYSRSKALAEAAVLGADCDALRTVALRPHLIFGPGDPHLLPRVVDRAKSGRLRIVGDGKNRVDVTYVGDAADAHLNALDALDNATVWGKAYFISQGEPVLLWPWLNSILDGLGHPPLERKVSLGTALFLGSVCETLWKVIGRQEDPPMTRFVAEQLAKDHYFAINAAREDLGFRPSTPMPVALERTLADLQKRGY